MAVSQKNAIDVDIAATRADLYTATAGGWMLSLTIANIEGAAGGSDPTIDVELYDSSATTYSYIAKDVPVPFGSSLQITARVALEAGDKISLTASAAGDLSATGSFVEIT